MGFVEVNQPHPSPPSPRASVALPDAVMSAWLRQSGPICDDEASDLAGLHPTSISLRCSDVARIAVLVETATAPRIISPISSDFPASVRALFAAAEDAELCVATLDWPPLRLSLVVDCSETGPRRVSFATAHIAALQPGHKGYPALLAGVAKLVQKYSALYLVLRIAPSPPGNVYFEQDARDFFDGEMSGVSHLWGNDLQAQKERLRDVALRGADTGSLARQLAGISTPEKVPCGSDELREDKFVEVEGLFTSRRYKVDRRGGVVITARSHLLREGWDDGLPDGTKDSTIRDWEVAVSRTSAGRSCHLMGDAAGQVALATIAKSQKVRTWFLSMLFTGKIIIDDASTADSFVPPNIRRRRGKGVRLVEPIPAWYFRDIGGAVANLQGDVFFKGHQKDVPRRVASISSDGVLTIGDIIDRPGAYVATYHWTLQELTLGYRS